MPRWVARVRAQLHPRTWAEEPPPGWRGAPIWTVRTLALVVRGFARREMFVRAGALTYSLVLSIIPFFAVMLAAFKGFGGLQSTAEHVKALLLRHLTPDTSSEAVRTINELIERMNAAAIGAVGFAALLYTSISLLSSVEKSFNIVWGVRRSRSFLRRFMVYWTFMTLAPLLLAISITASGAIQNHAAFQWITTRAPVVNTALIFLAPFFLTWAVFAGMYLVLPNTRVPWKAALAGALVAGTVWELLKHLYVFYNTRVAGTNEIYGSLAAIPVFLLWIYLSWVIVLFGAELVFAIQHRRTYPIEMEAEQLSETYKERLALRLMLHIGQDFLAGRESGDTPELAKRLRAPTRAVNEVLHCLIRARLLRPVRDGESTYLPGEDTDHITVKRILDAIRTCGEHPPVLAGDTLFQRADRLVEEAEAVLERATLRELLTEERVAERL
ncbi:MAG: YihY/virulence factor BrkB family protein [Planctomycetes bacterium]|nr:YihY/virulence factor BrkB family protein [Planctomycetota bacterium]